LNVSKKVLTEQGERVILKPGVQRGQKMINQIKRLFSCLGRLDVYCNANEELSRGIECSRVQVPINWSHPHYNVHNEVEIEINRQVIKVIVMSAKHKIGKRLFFFWRRRFWMYRCVTDVKSYNKLVDTYGETPGNKPKQ
jgi:hypothetical protein